MLIIFSTFIPIFALIIVIIYRHVKRKNAEMEEQQKEFRFSQVEKERQRIFEEMQKENELREREIFDNKLKADEKPSTSGMSKMIDVPDVLHINSDDETDDEFFELPLPPIPIKTPPRSAESGQISIIDNEAVDSPSVKSVRFETPKIQNIRSSFQFPSPPTRYAPPPPLNLESNYESAALAKPSIIDDENVASPTSIDVEALVHAEMVDENSSKPIIVGMKPKSLLQSDF